MADKIIVLDYGSQYNQLIARRIREFGVYSELVHHTISFEEIISKGEVKGIVLSGGPHSVNDEDRFGIDPKILTSGLPILGICYGMQLIHHELGGKIEACEKKEYGLAYIDTKESLLFDTLDEKEKVWMSHGDQVVQLAPGFRSIASTATCPYAASENKDKKIYTVQFHPEVRNSEHGLTMLKNFVFKVCQASANWTMKDFAKDQIEKIRSKVKNEKVLLALSGGVDSSVAAVLLSKAIGKNLYCMFIDHGLLRKNEAEEVVKMCTEHMDINLVKIDASKQFLEKLKRVDDP